MTESLKRVVLCPAACPHGRAGAAWAERKELVGSWAASGFIIKDTVEVTALDDPEGQQDTKRCDARPVAS